MPWSSIGIRTGEVQNLGFEIERRQVGGEPTLIKSFTDDPALQAKAPWGANYETTDDEGLANGVYTYDLYQTDQNGIRTHAGTQTVDFSEVSMPTELSIFDLSESCRRDRPHPIFLAGR